MAPNTPNKQRPTTQRDIAQHCGVSRTTVSYALQGDTSHVPAETIARVRAAADKLDYSPDAQEAARRLIMRRYGKAAPNRMIGFCQQRGFHANAYFLEPFLGAMDALAAAGYDQLTLTAEGDFPPDFLANSPAIARGDVDALIVFSISENMASLLQQMQRLPSMRQRPFVSLITPIPAPCSRVLYGDEQAAFAIGAHLTALGHRHLLFLRVSYNLALLLPRDRGLTRALTAAYGADAPPLQVWEITSHWISEKVPFADLRAMNQAADVSLEAYLTAHPEITAIVAENDWCAQHVWRVLEGMGKRVPADYSLVGYDDADLLRDADGHRQLTTIHLPLRRLGEAAVHLAIARITGEIPEDQDVVLPGELIVRRSTGPASR